MLLNYRNRPTKIRVSRKNSWFVRIVACCLFIPDISYAFHLPLWELGFGPATLNSPHYRGSKSETNIVIPFPFAIYRGDFLRVDSEEGISGKLFKSDIIDLDLSLAGNIPVPDTDDGVRAGMPKLDLLLEAGPELNIKLWKSIGRDKKLSFIVPYRLVFSVGNGVDYQGWTFSPFVDFEVKLEKTSSLTRFRISLGPIYADKKYHNYFYQVLPNFATATRQTYHAESGYSGNRVTVSISRNNSQYFIGAFARYDSLKNAVFADSPLVETKNYLVFGFALAWIFDSSDIKVTD